MEGIKCIFFINKDDLKGESIVYEDPYSKVYYDQAHMREAFNAEENYPKYTGGLKKIFEFILIAISQSIIYYSWMLYKDVRKSKLDQHKIKSKIDDDDYLYEPEVVEEEKRLDDPQCDDMVKVCRLTKQYPNGFTAVRNNNFGVRKGEIFGLLGPNGAGKSTTFNILTSLIPKTSGSVKLKNTEVNKGIMDVY